MLALCWALAGLCYSQQPEISEGTPDPNSTSLQLVCKNCAAINELEIRGEGVSYSKTFSDEDLVQNFPHTLLISAGDYVLRVKLRGKPWKMFHFYVRKDQQEILTLN